MNRCLIILLALLISIGTLPVITTGNKTDLKKKSGPKNFRPDFFITKSIKQIIPSLLFALRYFYRYLF